jgi:hypothetical protein
MDEIRSSRAPTAHSCPEGLLRQRTNLPAFKGGISAYSFGQNLIGFGSLRRRWQTPKNPVGKVQPILLRKSKGGGLNFL